MFFRRIAPLLLVLAGAGCGSHDEAKAPSKGPSVASMVEGDSGRVPATDFYVDAKGRVWVNRNATYTPRGSANADAEAIRNSAWLGRIQDRLQIGFELTDPRHLSPRPAPEKGHWLQAHCPEAVVARIRAGDEQAATR